MRRSTNTLAFVALTAVAAAPAMQPDTHGFTTPVAKSAAADHDRAVVHAADAYRKAVAVADKAYSARLAQIAASPQVKAANGELARVQQARADADQQQRNCADSTLVVALVLPGEAVVATALRKGIGKAALLHLYPAKPAADRTDLDGTETIVWEDRQFSGGATDFETGGFTPIGSHVIGSTTVTLSNGVVVDFSVEKR